VDSFASRLLHLPQENDRIDIGTTLMCIFDLTISQRCDRVSAGNRSHYIHISQIDNLLSRTFLRSYISRRIARRTALRGLTEILTRSHGTETHSRLTSIESFSSKNKLRRQARDVLEEKIPKVFFNKPRRGNETTGFLRFTARSVAPILRHAPS
jgi:hypothetical protein